MIHSVHGSTNTNQIGGITAAKMMTALMPGGNETRDAMRDETRDAMRDDMRDDMHEAMRSFRGWLGAWMSGWPEISMAENPLCATERQFLSLALG